MCVLPTRITEARSSSCVLILILSLGCTNIRTMGFYNCGFREPIGSEDQAFEALDRHTKREEMMMMSLCWLDLERLNITSEVRLQGE